MRWCRVLLSLFAVGCNSYLLQDTGTQLPRTEVAFGADGQPATFPSLTFRRPPKDLSPEAATEDWPSFLGPRRNGGLLVVNVGSAGDPCVVAGCLPRGAARARPHVGVVSARDLYASCDQPGPALRCPVPRRHDQRSPAASLMLQSARQLEG